MVEIVKCYLNPVWLLSLLCKSFANKTASHYEAVPITFRRLHHSRRTWPERVGNGQVNYLPGRVNASPQGQKNSRENTTFPLAMYVAAKNLALSLIIKIFQSFNLITKREFFTNTQNWQLHQLMVNKCEGLYRKIHFNVTCSLFTLKIHSDCIDCLLMSLWQDSVKLITERCTSAIVQLGTCPARVWLGLPLTNTRIVVEF